MAKKILLINGGGSFGAIPAKFLACLTKKYDTDFRTSIDCLSGSSIGGILASMYAVGVHPQTIEEQFLDACRQIFKKRWWAKLNPLSSPTYSDEALINFIKKFVGDYRVEDIRKIYPNLDVFFAGLDLTDDYFKVWDNITGADDRELLHIIDRITCAAPTYFDAAEYNGHAMVDSGLIDNTMILTTTTGYKEKRGVPFEDMDVLLIGTGFAVDKEDDRITAKKYNAFSQVGILKKLIIPYVTQSNELASIFWARNLGLRNFYYFNPVSIKGAMDEPDLLPDILNMSDAYLDVFYRTWELFTSDTVLDKNKDIESLLVLPEGIGERIYRKARHE